MPYQRGIQQYFEKSVYISSGDYTTDQTHTGAIVQLSRIQDVTIGVNYPLQQDMYLDAGDESYLATNAGITLDIKYLHTNGVNETFIGLAALLPPTGALGFNLDAEKSIYIAIENQPRDAVGASGVSQTKTVIGIAQALLTQYQLTASVGSIIESEASFDCLTSFIYTGATGNQVPAVNYQNGAQVTGLFVLPPASSQYLLNEPSGYFSTGNADYVSAISANDLIMTFPQNSPFGVVFSGQQSCYLQSVHVSLSFDRHPFRPMGYAFPASRPILYPMHIELDTEAVVSSYQLDQLERLSCLGTGHSINVIVKQPCSNATLFGLYFTNLQLESQNFTTTIGRNDAVSIRWRGIISNPYQMFFDPTVNYLINLATSGAYGTNW